MVTLRTTHHLGAVDIANALMRFASSGFGEVEGPDLEGNPGKDITRPQLDAFVREVIQSWGVDAYRSESMWYENYTDDEMEDLAVWAATQLRRLHPELDDEPLREWLASYTREQA